MGVKQNTIKAQHGNSLSKHHLKEREKKLALCETEEERKKLIEKWDKRLEQNKLTKEKMAKLLQEVRNVRYINEMLMDENNQLKVKLQQFSKT